MRGPVRSIRLVAVLSASIILVFVAGCSEPAPQSKPKVLLVGLDGADWDVMKPLMDRGELPNISSLVARGVRARMKSIQPIISPVIWTTIATGYGPDDHGVIDFTVPDPTTGDPIVITSRHRLAKAFWNLLSERGRDVGVVGWWASWPAEKVRGQIVSDRVLAHAFVSNREEEEELTYPRELAADLRPQLLEPADVTIEDAARFMKITPEEWNRADSHDFNDPIGHFRHIYSTMKNVTTAGLQLLADPTDLVAVYYEGTDTAGHMYMRYAPPSYPYTSEEEHEKYGQTVDSFLRQADTELGRLLEELPEDAYVMIVSDHGFLAGDQRPMEERANQDYRTAALWHDIEGVFLLAGPGVRAGASLPDVTIFDVLPTLLTLLDLPVADDFRGRSRTDAFIESPELTTVASYRDPAWSEARKKQLLEAANQVDGEMMEKLRSLGYVGGSETGSLVSLRGRLALAQYHLFVGERVQAVEELRGVIADAPDFYEAHYQLGQTAMQSGELEAAERYFRRTLEIESEHIPSFMNLAFILKQSNRSGEAVQALETATMLDPLDPGPVINLAILLRETGNGEAAVERLDGILARLPRHRVAWIQKAITLHQGARYEDAASAWETVLSIQPDDARAREYLERARNGQEMGPG